jgi:hypothetical protein
MDSTDELSRWTTGVLSVILLARFCGSVLDPYKFDEYWDEEVDFRRRGDSRLSSRALGKGEASSCFVVDYCRPTGNPAFLFL